MKKLNKRDSIDKRNSSIELLKVFGIILIVISHVIQTLHSQNTHIMQNDYVLDISMATTNVQQLIIVFLRYSGALGNTIFFCCSAWFLLDNDNVSKKKAFQMLVDVWVVSVITLIAVYIIKDGNIGIKIIIKQLLPTTFENNWYITCYLLFYLLHPFLNQLIKNMEQKALLKTALFLLFLYVCVNYIFAGSFFSTYLILWVTLYITIAYMKYYLVDLSNNTKVNIIMLLIGFAGNISIVLLTNYLGLHLGVFRNWLLRWNTSCSPFLILIAISMLNIAKNVCSYNKTVNYISSLSLLIYIFHENQLLRIFYRPLLWNFVYSQFGYEYILFWLFVLVIIVFGFGLIASIIYKNTIQKIVANLCNRVYPSLQKIYGIIEHKILKFH